jgi:tetratricopeptide (TPR) repeat protein
MLFSLRFRAQLRRTRGGLISSLEESLIGAIEASGGNIRVERKFITASFDETAAAFWLDLLTVLETLLKDLGSAASELYGHVCVIGKDLSEDLLLMLPKMLPSGSDGAGIWCAPFIQKALEPYMDFDTPRVWMEASPLVEGYARIKNVKIFSPDAPAELFPLRGKIQRLLKKGGRRNVVLLGPEFIGKRDGLFRFCAHYMGGFPPLVLRFGSGGRGLSCLADALGPELNSLLKDGEVLKELDALGARIIRDRLRDEFSAYSVREGERFFSLLLDAYAAAAARRKAPPVLVLENIHEAGDTVRQVFLNVYRAFSEKKSIPVYGTCAGEGCLKLWEAVFPQVLHFSRDDIPVLPAEGMPGDLWEIAWMCELLRPYFPGFLFSRLIGEAGKNPVMISRAFGMLSHFGVIDISGDLRPRIHGFADKAGAILGERRERIRFMVRNRLLDWVLSGRLKTCFNLLRALAELGGEGTDDLILDTLYGDLSSGTYAGIEAAVRENRFSAVVGASRAPALLYIFTTLRGLMYGDETEIREAFQKPYPEDASSPYYQAQIFTNVASYSLSKNDVSAASDAIKESMLINQSRKKGRGLARTYRLFSLVNLSGRSLSDAIEYFTFAIESAEKSEDFDELAVILYYAAGTYFLFGNISRAEQLALRAEQTAASSGRPEWADRSRFLRGRLRFESGRYKNALEIFETLQKNPFGSVSPAFASVLSAWIYRSHVFLQNPEARPPADRTIDGLFFEMEASYLTGNFRRTAELSDQSQSLISGGEFLFIEQPDWRSGFAQCELFLFPRKVFWERLISTYRALALSRLGHPRGTDKEQAVRIMERILRDEWQPDTDPCDAFYCYARYRVLQEYGAPEVDMNTAISMAFKRLQRRASHIDDPETKRAFLSLHYWNSSLGLAAKKHKLI